MKITKIETLCLSRLHELERQWMTARFRSIEADCAIVVIHKDDGLQGIGEASAYGWPRIIQEGYVSVPQKPGLGFEIVGDYVEDNRV